LTLSDREDFDRALDTSLGHEQVRRTSWWFNAVTMQSVSMAAMLDGDWGAAEAAVAEVTRLADHDVNFRLGCKSQRTWVARETGDVEVVYQQSLGIAAAMADFPAARSGLVTHAAEAGHIDHVVALLDELAPADFAAVGRGWLTVLVLGELAWGAVTADATAHAAVLRRLLHPYSGQMARNTSGTHVMCSIDRLLAGLAAVDGDHTEADRLFALALAQEKALRAPPLATRTRHWWGRALARRGDTDRARPLLAEARAAAHELGMRGLVAQIDDLTSGKRDMPDRYPLHSLAVHGAVLRVQSAPLQNSGRRCLPTPAERQSLAELSQEALAEAGGLLGRRPEATSRSRRADESLVQSGERGIQKFSRGHVPGVIGREIVTKLPDASGDHVVRDEFDTKVDQVGVSERSDVVADLAGVRRASQYVGHLDWEKMRRSQIRCEQRLCPPSVGAGINEGGDDRRGVDHNHHRRPASRCLMILEADRFVDVRCLRSTMRRARASGSGRLARSINSLRRYSCRDRPDRAAREASSSRALSGTSRTVIEGTHA